NEPAQVTLNYHTGWGEVPGPTLTVEPGSRATVDVSDTVETFEVSTLIKSDRPVVAERAMYFVRRAYVTE
ncbi:MAG: hypothetical protein L6433_02335, partial [Actinomycetia bacterium]|nr:hypothetical protein [Actinomycetes bacterium]